MDGIANDGPRTHAAADGTQSACAQRRLQAAAAVVPDVHASGPADSWAAEVAELRRRQAIAAKHGGERGVARQRKHGKLLARERIALLLDAGSFREVGSLAASTAEYDNDDVTGPLKNFVPANFVGGRGACQGRALIVGADDFSVRGGHADGAIFMKQVYIEALARELRVPSVRLLDGSSGGGSVATYLKMDYTYVPRLPGFQHAAAMLSEVPVAAALLGPVVGFGAGRAMMSHFSVMVAGVSQLFVAGPPVVAHATYESVTKEELGGVGTQASNGAVDNVAASERDALRQVRTFLSYLPSSVWRLAPRAELSSGDAADRREEALLSIVPKNRRHTFDMRRVISLVADTGSFFEVGATWGRSAIVGLARLDGFAVGVLSTDCRVRGGVLTANAAEKVRRHVDLCNTFHVPIVAFVDQPGFSVGLHAERTGTIRRGAAMIASLFVATVPYFAVIVRRAFGVAGAAFVDRGDPNVAIAWPSGDWGSLPLEGGIEAAYKRQLAEADDREGLRQQLLSMFEARRSPLRTAAAFAVEEVVDPRDTRPLVCEWAGIAYSKLDNAETLRCRPGSYRP